MESDRFAEIRKTISYFNISRYIRYSFKQSLSRA